MLTNPNGSEAATADTNFTSALLSALYGLPTLQDYSVPTSCKTGNCTWGPYQTLAVCSTCQDITSQGSVNAKGDWSLPNGFRLAYLSNFNMTTSVQYEDSPLGPDITSLLESYAFADRGSIMADLFIAHYNNSDEVQAHECLLQYCVQTYNATEKNGILTETSMLPFAYSDDSTSAGADLLGPDSDRQSDIYLYNLRPPSSPSIPGLNTSQTFNVVSDAQSRISLLFATTFNGSQAANGGPEESFGTTQVASFFYDQITAVDNPIDYLNTMTGNIAASLTRHMRTHKWGDFGTLTSWRSPPMHTGIATRYAVVVHVQWAWIILPVIVLAATLIFLGAVIWAAERKRTYAWKNNALVALMLDLDDEQLRHRLPGDLGELRDLEHALGKEKARMVWEGRVRFKTG